MKIVCISDTHGDHYKLRPQSGELLIHSGDFSSYGHQKDTRDFLEWYQAQPHPLKVLVAGNHDKLPFERPGLFQDLLKKHAPDVTYLEDQEANLGGFTIWGAPWTPTFLNWYFMADRGSAIRNHWDRIPNGIDIIVTHGPAYGHLDLSQNYNSATGRKFEDHLGCADLMDAIVRTKPLLHTCGHIHGSGGNIEEFIHSDGAKTLMVNASVMDEDYMPSHGEIVIEL